MTLQLDRWAKRQELDDKALCRLLRINRVTLWRWRTGYNVPTVRQMLRVAAKTEGTVAVHHWVLDTARLQKSYRRRQRRARNGNSPTSRA